MWLPGADSKSMSPLERRGCLPWWGLGWGHCFLAGLALTRHGASASWRCRSSHNLAQLEGVGLAASPLGGRCPHCSPPSPLRTWITQGHVWLDEGFLSLHSPGWALPVRSRDQIGPNRNICPLPNGQRMPTAIFLCPGLKNKINTRLSVVTVNERHWFKISLILGRTRSNATSILSLMTLTGPRNPGGPMSPFHPYGERQLQSMSTLTQSIYIFRIPEKQNAVKQ